MFHCSSHGNYQTLKDRIGLETANVVPKRATNWLGVYSLFKYIKMDGLNISSIMINLQIILVSVKSSYHTLKT